MLQDCTSMNNLLHIKQKYNDAIAVKHMKVWVDQGRNVHILNWLQTLRDEMESLLYHYNSSTIPPRDPPYAVHHLIQVNS